MSTEKKDMSQLISEDEAKYIAKCQKIPYLPIAFEKGDGALLYDYDGKEYIDFLASASSMNIGHGNKEIAEAVKNQMENLSQYVMAYFNVKEPVELAKKLVSIAPISGEKKVMFSMTGSASIDGAIKLAKAYTKRTKLISFSESYHGSTFGAISVSALSLNMVKSIGRLPDVYHFSYPDSFRCKYGSNPEENWQKCLEEIEYAFKHYLPAEEVAALFFEPIAGDAGLIIPPAAYVKALKKLCEDHGILFVVDEIQQAVGRTGKWFGIENFGVEPDLIVMGKSLGAGLPVGAVIGRKEIMDSLESPGHVFTLAGYSAGCVASLKMFEIIERDHILEHCQEMGSYIVEKLNVLKDKYDIIGDVRGMGLSVAVDFVKDRETREKNFDATLKVCYNAMKEGLVMIYLGESVLRIQPPLVITKEQIDKAIDIIDRSIQKYLNNEIGDHVYDEIKGW